MDLKKVLERHALWVSSEPGGKRADLRGANLTGANLTGADLTGADLTGADLTGADLTGRTPLFADTARNYVLFVIDGLKDGPRFFAGCRNFTEAKAVEHWTNISVQPGYVAAIKAWVETRKAKA